MGRKISDKGLTKKLDKLWRDIVKKRAGSKCEVCGNKESLNSHHIISRGNFRLRWDTQNGCCLCTSHHLFDRHKSAHLNPIWFDEWLKENRLEDYKHLKLVQYEIKQWKKWEKEERVEELEEILKAI